MLLNIVDDGPDAAPASSTRSQDKKKRKRKFQAKAQQRRFSAKKRAVDSGLNGAIATPAPARETPKSNPVSREQEPSTSVPADGAPCEAVVKAASSSTSSPSSSTPPRIPTRPTSQVAPPRKSSLSKAATEAKATTKAKATTTTTTIKGGGKARSQRVASKDGPKNKERHSLVTKQIRPEIAEQVSRRDSQSQSSKSKEIAFDANTTMVSRADLSDAKATPFSELGLSERLVSLLQAPTKEGGMGFQRPTAVQVQSIPALAAGRDVLIKSQTGSGKTLAFGLPIINDLHQRPERLKRGDGLLALILSPTRELCFQIHSVLERITRPFHWLVIGSLVGGEKRKSEKARLRKGFNVLVATPGRLMDHLEHTEALVESLRRGVLEWLVLDEADRLTDAGFLKQISAILDWIEENKVASKTRMQTVLCSATLNSKVEELADRSLVNPVKVEIDQALIVPTVAGDGLNEAAVQAEDGIAMPSTLMQHFVVVNSKERLVALSSFVLRQVRRYRYTVKIVLFVSCRAVVDFLHRVLPKVSWPPRREDGEASASALASTSSNVGLGTKWWRLHGSIDQHERRKAIAEFGKAKNGVLICTDVAARGLDLPFVDWIIQYDPPSEISEYVHRVGRTARSGRRGSALLFLTPQERSYVSLLEARSVRLTEIHAESVFATLVKYGRDQAQREGAPAGKSLAARALRDSQAALALFQVKLEDLVDQDKGDRAKKQKALKVLAEDAFVAFVRAYAVHSKETKPIFHPKNLHLGHVARSFALREQPTGVSKDSKVRYDARTKRKQERRNEKDFLKLGTKVNQLSEFAAS